MHEMHTKFSVGNLEGRDHLEDLNRIWEDNVL